MTHQHEWTQSSRAYFLKLYTLLFKRNRNISFQHTSVLLTPSECENIIQYQEYKEDPFLSVYILNLRSSVNYWYPTIQDQNHVLTQPGKSKVTQRRQNQHHWKSFASIIYNCFAAIRIVAAYSMSAFLSIETISKINVYARNFIQKAP